MREGSPVYREIVVQVEADSTSVAILEDHRLVEVYTEKAPHHQLVGNIYRGRVENVLPGMQAAFVDIGLEKNAFLYVRDAITGVVPGTGPDQEVAIGDVLKQGQEVLVQLVKEPHGGKGARVTRQITLPGRYLVLVPGVDQVGVSRRVEGEEERQRLRKMAQEVKPASMGVIVRTAAEGVTREELAADARALVEVWERIKQRTAQVPVPGLVHRDHTLVYRILRDHFTGDVDAVKINCRETYVRAMEMATLMVPELKGRIALETGDLFAVRDIPAQVQQALRKRIWLKSGGYVVFDHTEALTVIDVNTGKYVGTTTLADTVLKTNLEAVTEIARQLRLRNVGGIIVIDFIDMVSAVHQETVLQALEQALKRDRTKTSILGLTRLGLVEMTRKKTGRGLWAEMQRPCPCCHGTGRVLAEEAVAADARRELELLTARSSGTTLLVEAHPGVAAHLIGPGGVGLARLEEKTGKRVVVRGVETFGPEEVRLREGDDSVQDAPVSPGQVLTVRVETPHASLPGYAIARMHGFVLEIEGGVPLIGQEVEVRVTRVWRTHARAVPTAETGIS